MDIDVNYEAEIASRSGHNVRFVLLQKEIEAAGWRITAIIDRVELAYYAPPGALSERPGAEAQPEFSLVQPVWVFHGHSEDGRATFRAYVQAGAGDYLQ